LLLGPPWPPGSGFLLEPLSRFLFALRWFLKLAIWFGDSVFWSNLCIRSLLLPWRCCGSQPGFGLFVQKFLPWSIRHEQ
jgi:hypothetical protein